MDQSFLNSQLTTQESSNIKRLLLVSFFLIMTTAFVAYQARKRNEPDITIKEFFGININYFTTRRGLMILFVGMIAGIVVGLVDNAGLWFGISTLEPFFIKKMGLTPGSLEVSAYTNIFANGLGSLLGTFFAIILSEYTNIELDEGPVWVDTFGVIIGCFIGIQVGKLVR